MSGGAIAGGLIAGCGLASSGINPSYIYGFFGLCLFVVSTTWGVCKYLNYRDAIGGISE